MLESSEVVLPAGVEMAEGGQLESDVEEGAEEGQLASVSHGLVEGFEIDDRLVPGAGLAQRCGRLVVLGEQSRVVDEGADVLLEVCGYQSDHDACDRRNAYLAGSSSSQSSRAACTTPSCC